MVTSHEKNRTPIEQRIEEEIDVKLSLNFDRSSNFAGVCNFRYLIL